MGEDIGFVGRIERVNAGIIEHIAEDYIPVIASVGADRAGRSHNVNADEAAAAVARALGAYKIIFLTDVPGWLSEPSDPESVISEAGADEVEAAMPATAGGMRPKLQACLDAIHGGVSYAHIVDGRVPALGAARAVHRRRPGHEDQARSVSALAETYARFPVEFASGLGRRAGGRRTGPSTSTSSAASRSATPATATRTSCGRSRSRRRG